MLEPSLILFVLLFPQVYDGMIILTAVKIFKNLEQCRGHSGSSKNQ
jgi:hypothetical protein